MPAERHCGGKSKSMIPGLAAPRRDCSEAANSKEEKQLWFWWPLRSEGRHHTTVELATQISTSFRFRAASVRHFTAAVFTVGFCPVATWYIFANTPFCRAV